MEDSFENFAPGLSAPATRALMVSPHDVTPLPFLPRAIYVGSGGDIMMRGEDGADALWKNVPPGTVLPFRPVLIQSTGTTAANLLALD